MRIIKEGKRPEDELYEFHCGNCGTIFEIKQSEGKIIYDQRDGNFLTYSCPVCRKQCTHDLSAF